ncbi:MAG: hypothetical protein O3A37_10140 [Planctomycetota bacterium]|jgi:hypothetical protein|nr:hypothetical protein [Planctomycetota bacterium]
MSLRTEFRDRERRIRIADARASEANELARNAVESNSKTTWRAAVTRFRTAATLYRQAGLGLLAKAQWLSCAACVGALGDTEGAATCRREAEVIPVYWEGEK